MISIKTITICGSMKFSEQMKKIAWRLESEQGFNVLQCAYNDGNEPLTDQVLKQLINAITALNLFGNKINYKLLACNDGIK